MDAWLRSETFWLDLTNAALGLVTLVCVLAIGIGVVQDLVPRLRGWLAHETDDHSLYTPELGLTMADGGRPVRRRRRNLLSWRRKAR
jgi:hypothetical protein